MALHKDLNNQIHDDMSGTALRMLPQGCVEITDQEAEVIRLAATLPPTYQELRIAKYPPMTDYLDAIVKGDLVQRQAYIDACLTVKAEFSKV